MPAIRLPSICARTPIAALTPIAAARALHCKRNVFEPAIHDAPIDVLSPLSPAAIVTGSTAELGRRTIEAERLHACSYG